MLQGVNSQSSETWGGIDLDHLGGRSLSSLESGTRVGKGGGGTIRDTMGVTITDTIEDSMA